MALVAVGAGWSGGGTVSAQVVSNLTQSSFVIDGVPYSFTEYGSFDLTYTGSSSDQYLNVNYNGQWIIQNMPLVAREGVGFTNTETFSFPLGTGRGIDLTGSTPGSFNAVVTNGLGVMPSAAPTSLAFAQEFNIYSQGGKPAALLGVLPAFTGAIVGVTTAPPMLMKGGHKDFPNQEQGLNECAPTAVSNSLQFLKAQNPGAAWGSLPLDIATMKTATNWAADGCWIFPDPTRPVGQRNAWWQDKNNYMIANGYPIMTMQTTSLADMLTAVKAGKDVELEMQGHTAAIVGMADLGMGNYSITIAHDLKQGMAGGLTVETFTYKAATGKFEGGKWANGHTFNYGVIEMVPSPATVTAMLLGGILAGRRRRRA